MKSVSTGRITGAIERKVVQPALAESYEEALLHHVGLSRFLLTWKEASLVDELRDRRLKGAIGVIYLPKTERFNHYFYASLPAQFDVVIHFDETHAVEPLDQLSGWATDDAPETYPTGL